MYGDRPLLIHFNGGNSGEWRVTGMQAVAGEAIGSAPFLAVTIGDAERSAATVWSLAGVTSNLRYTTAGENADLAARQAGLGRESARRAALIPIRKTAKWWTLAQDERRAIYARSAHTPIGLEYLPAIARRLHHSRDLGEPFDFLTWFEFAAADEPAFDILLARLRATEEWTYVDHEIDIRLERSDAA